MKIALCLSGQPRAWRAGYEYINKNLLSKHDVDVFLHFWTQRDDIQLMQDIIELYKPVKWDTKQEFVSTFFNRFDRNGGPGWPPRNPYHSYYSVFHCNLLKKDREMKQGYYYDYVVRTRFDYALNRELPFSEVKDNKIYIPADRMNESHTVGSDAFAFGTSKTVDRYCMTYMYLDYFYDKLGCPMNAEEMLAMNLSFQELNGDNLVYVDMNNPFLPDQFGSMPHSFIREDYTKWKKINETNSARQ